MTVTPDLIEIASVLDRLASLVERMADTTPDDRDRSQAREVAIEAGNLFVRLQNKGAQS